MKNFFSKNTQSSLPFSIGMPAIVWQVFFFYIPLLIIVVSSFVKVSDMGLFEGFTLQKILLFLTPTYLGIILSSIALGISNALICLAIAYPLAYFMAFRGKKFKNLLLFLLIVPFWTNFLLHVYAWFYVLEREGFINNILLSLGLIQEPLHFLNSLFSIMIMMVYYYLPFMVMPIYASLERFDIRLIEASYDLGASWIQTFRKVMLPLTLSGVRAGFFLVYIPSFGEFAIPELMGGDKLMFVGSAVSHYILGDETGSLGAAFTVVSCFILFLTTALLFLLFNRLIKPRMQHA